MDTGEIPASNSKEQTAVTVVCTAKAPVKAAVMAAGTGIQEQGILPVTPDQEPRPHSIILNKSENELAELLK